MQTRRTYVSSKRLRHGEVLTPVELVEGHATDLADKTESGVGAFTRGRVARHCAGSRKRS